MKLARESMGVVSTPGGHTPLIAPTQWVRGENRETLASRRTVMENVCDLVRGEEGEGGGVDECSFCQNPP